MSSEGTELGTRTPDLPVTFSVLGAEEHLFQCLSPLSPSPQLVCPSQRASPTIKNQWQSKQIGACPTAAAEALIPAWQWAPRRRWELISRHRLSCLEAALGM